VVTWPTPSIPDPKPVIMSLPSDRGRVETPIWIAEHRTLVFADALAGAQGELLVWDCPALQQRALPRYVTCSNRPLSA
jgi:hypothetical protein